MVVLKQFWTPCYWYDEVHRALQSIAFYTAMLSIIFIAYTCYVLNGGESSQYYMPYFETDRASNMDWVCSFVIIFMITLFFASIALVLGTKEGSENRGLMIPWLALILCIIFYQLWLGMWLLYAYYIYLSTVLFVLVNWIWMSYNIYAWLGVYSVYQQIKIRQTPNFEFMYP